MAPNPHDALFKYMLGDPQNARGLFQSIMPPAVTEALDWNTLTHCSGSLVDSRLRGRHSDLLFSLRWRGDEDAFLYILFEHQSTSDPLMPFRLLVYKTWIWERWLREHPNARRFPAILPIVFAHDEGGWRVVRSFDALLDIPEELRPELEHYLVDFNYLLEDLSDASDAELRTRTLMSALITLTLLIFKHASSERDIVKLFRTEVDLVRTVARAPNGLAALDAIFTYVLSVNKHMDDKALRAFLEREVPEAKEPFMTAAERLIAQGLEQGRQRSCNLLLRVLQNYFGSELDASSKQRILAASTEQLDVWAGRLQTGATIQGVLTD